MGSPSEDDLDSFELFASEGTIVVVNGGNDCVVVVSLDEFVGFATLVPNENEAVIAAAAEMAIESTSSFDFSASLSTTAALSLPCCTAARKRFKRVFDFFLSYSWSLIENT